MSRRSPASSAAPGGDVEIGVEIAGFREELVPRGGEGGRGDDQLEQVHRGRIGDDDLVRLRPDQGCDGGADALRRLDPAARIPASDQLRAPFLLDHRPLPGDRGLGQCSERIAVEVDHALGQDEAVAARPERIGGVERSDCSSVVGHRPHRSG
jgi:hypothetical protein